MPEFLTKSNLARKISAKLKNSYNHVATFYCRRSVEKGFQLDEFPTGLSLSPNTPIDLNPPYIISALDFVMYIVDAIMQKTLSTQQREVVGWVIPSVGRVLGSDFVGMVQRKMRDEDYPKPGVQGGLPPEEKIIRFIVLINSLDISNDYLSRIVSSKEGEGEGGESGSSIPNGSSSGVPGLLRTGGIKDEVVPPKHLRDTFPFDSDAAFVVSTLKSLESSFHSKTSELMAEGLKVLFNNVVKLRLRPVMSETFRDADYQLTESELRQMKHELGLDGDGDDGNCMGSGDLVARRFEEGWDQLMKPLSRILTPRTYSSLLDTTAKSLAKTLEKKLWSHYGGKVNALGAVRMERDFGGIIAVVGKKNYAVREVFGRVSQILMVANMEEDEWVEVSAAAKNENKEDVDRYVEWVLSVEERKRARGLVAESG